MASEWRILTLHFEGDITQRVKFSSTSTRDDLLAGIREVLGIEAGRPLRFRDSDGDIVLISPQGMPSGTVLHVAVESGLPCKRPRREAAPNVPANPVAAAAGAWRVWQRFSGRMRLSEDRLLASHDDSAEAWAVYTPALPTSGRHYLVVNIQGKRPCCASIGLIPSHLASVPQGHLIGNPSFPALVSLMGVGGGPSQAHESSTGGAPPLAIGVLFDADARRMVLVPHDDPRNPRAAIRIDDVPVPATFVITSPKHGIRAAIQPELVMPPQGVYEGVDACLGPPEAR